MTKVDQNTLSVTWSEKVYSDPATKFRCVAEFVFDEAAYNAALDEYERRKGMRTGDGKALAGKLGARNEVQSIEAAINYVFNRPIKPQRFNDDTFDALYTAKEIDTAVKEFEYYWKGNQPLPAIVFSVDFVGRAADVRPAFGSDKLAWPANYDVCRPIGKAALDSGFDAVAAPSARRDGGSCCAILRQEKIRARRIEEKVLV